MGHEDPRVSSGVLSASAAAEQPDQVGEKYTFEDICFRPGGVDTPCYVVSPLDLLRPAPVDMDALFQVVASGNTCAEANLQDLLLCDDPISNIPGITIQTICPVSCGGHTPTPLERLRLAEATRLVSWDMDTLLGSIERADVFEAEDFLGFGGLRGSIQSAQAMKTNYLLSCEDGDGRCNNWEKEILDWLATEAVRTEAFADGIYTYGISLQGQQSEILRGSNEVNPLFGIASVMMVTFVSFSFYKTGPLSYHSKGLVGVQAIMAIQLTFAMSFGLTAVFGILFSSVTPVCGFLLLAIGTDDVFIIVSILDQIDTRLPVEERIGRAMSHAGPAILITSATSSLAFFAGSSIRFPAMRAFCLDAAIGITCVFGTAVTMIVACLAIHERHSTPIDKFIDAKRCSDRLAAAKVGDVSSRWVRFWRETWGPVVTDTNLKVKITIICVFVIVVIASAIQVANVKLQFVIEDVSKDSSRFSHDFGSEN